MMVMNPELCSRSGILKIVDSGYLALRSISRLR